MATLYVDTDVDGGLGDGSSLANAYASLSAAVAALPATFDDDYTILCYATDGTADTTNVVVNEDLSTYSLTIKAGTGHAAGTAWDTSKYRLTRSANYGSAALVLSSTTTVDGLQIASTGTIEAIAINPNSSNERILNCHVRGGTIGVFKNTGNGAVIVNTIVTDSSEIGIRVRLGGTMRLYNVTAVANGVGAQVFGFRTIIATNCYFGGNTTDVVVEDNGTFTPTDVMISDESVSGAQITQNVAYSTSAGAYFTNVTAGSEDLAIKADSDLIGEGTDLSEDAEFAFDYDILGTSRPQGTYWDIGAYEYVASGDDSISTDTIATTDEGSSNVEVSGTREDTATLADSTEDNVDVSSLSEDALALTDSAESIAVILSSVADALSLTDEGLAELVGAIEVTAVDTIVADDLGVSSATLNADAVDALALTDTGDTTESVDVAAADSLTLTDEVLIAVEIHVAAVDAIESADSGVTSVTFVVSAEDAAAFTDAAVSAGELIVEAVDSAGLTDSVVVTVNETAIVREYIFRPGGAVREITVPGGAVREITVPGGAVREIIVRGN